MNQSIKYETALKVDNHLLLVLGSPDDPAKASSVLASAESAATA